jgi:hypothetical protein
MEGDSAIRPDDARPNKGKATKLPALFYGATPPRKPRHCAARAALVPVAFKLRRLMTDSVYLNTMYFLTIGAMPHLAAPQSFNELINYRKLHDRNPDLVTTSDKYEVREYVTQRIGPGYLIPLYLQTTDPLSIDVETLPRSCVAKVNCGCGFNIFIRDTRTADWSEIVEKLQRWLRFPYHTSHREWAYKSITPRVLIEELLWDDGGVLPDDYKFHVFNGKVRMIQVHYDRFAAHRINLYDETFRLLDVEYQGPHSTDRRTPPDCLASMIAIAEKLAAEFPYARIDLYEHQGRIYFGEITHYPGAGLGVFDPPEFDRVLGDVWLHGTKIPERYYAG